MNNKIAKYTDLKNIKTIENNEPFVVVNFYDKNIRCEYALNDMKEVFDGKIVVRKKLAEMLFEANNILTNKYSNLSLSVAYGYRSLDIQKKYFDKEYNKIEKQGLIEKKDLIEATHKRVAAIDVAGHPTGGAVDVTLYNNKEGKLIDMGGDINDINDNRLPTFSIGLTDKQKDSRKILLDVMFAVGFCPFYEEWWHFSYGDKEWAFFYDKNNAIYDKVEIEKIII